MPADDLTLALRIRADTQQALAGMRAMNRSLRNTRRDAGRADSGMRRMVRTAGRLAVAYLGIRAAVGIIRSITGATEEQSQAIAQVERGLRNLEGQTTLTSAGLQEHAAALQQVTTTGDETILRLQSLLLTFRKIDETNFDRVTEASLDLAAVLGQAPRDAALQLGKALEDPVQGLTALRRSGTVFSQEQTRVIRHLAETNRLAEAQGLILEEVERQYRGAARAQRETLGGAAASLGNTIGDLLEQRDGARDLRLEIEGLNTAFKDRGASAAVRDFVEAITSGLAAAVGLAADLVAGIGDIYASLAPGVDTRAQRVRDFAAGGDGLRIRDFRNEPRLLAEADRQLAALRQRNAEDEAAIAHRDSLLRAREQDIAAANRAAAEGTALGIEELLSGGQAQTLSEQEREELSRRQRDLETRRESARRLEETIRLVRFPRFPPDRADRPPPNLRVRPQVEDAAGAAAQVAAQVEAIRAQHEDRLARLTLTRIELVNRAERAALADLDRRAAEEGADGGQIEAARTAVVAAAEEERRQLRIEGAREAARIGEEALAEEAQAQEDAAQRLAGARAQIEGREVELGLVSQYDAAIREAGRWRTETLADLDAVGGGSEALRARVEAVYASMVAEARAASQAQRAANEGWIEGVLSGLEQIGENSDSAFDAARDATIDTFRTMEDALASFVTTGKFSFSDFVDSVIADLARLAARQAVTIPLANALFGALGSAFGGAGGAADAGGADAFRRLQAGVGHRGGTVGAADGVSRSVPAAIFAGAPRYHAGGVAGLRPDEVPIIAQAGEVILPRASGATIPRGAQIAAPSIDITFENRGTPQREVSREVRLDPRGLIVTVVTEDLDGGGPASQAIARRFGLRDAVA